MQNKILTQSLSTFRIVLISSLTIFTLYTVQAWISPTVSAPNGNVGGPLTTATSTQIKTGSLGLLDSLSIGKDLIVNGTTTTNVLRILTGAGANKVLTSDASGNASWQTTNNGGGTLATAIGGNSVHGQVSYTCTGATVNVPAGANTVVFSANGGNGANSGLSTSGTGGSGGGGALAYDNTLGVWLFYLGGGGGGGRQSGGVAGVISGGTGATFVSGATGGQTASAYTAAGYTNPTPPTFNGAGGNGGNYLAVGGAGGAGGAGGGGFNYGGWGGGGGGGGNVAGGAGGSGAGGTIYAGGGGAGTQNGAGGGGGWGGGGGSYVSGGGAGSSYISSNLSAVHSSLSATNVAGHSIRLYGGNGGSCGTVTMVW